MFPTRMFGDRYFAPRYFPKVGAEAVVIGPCNIADHLSFSSGATDTCAHSSGIRDWGVRQAGAIEVNTAD